MKWKIAWDRYSIIHIMFVCLYEIEYVIITFFELFTWHIGIFWKKKGPNLSETIIYFRATSL